MIITRVKKLEENVGIEWWKNQIIKEVTFLDNS